MSSAPSLIAPVYSFVISLLCLALVPPLPADERIELFHAEIRVLPDGVMEVTETIRVAVEGSQIEHGIYRDFPVTSFNRFALRREHGFEVMDVKRDDRDEPFRVVEHLGMLQNITRVYMGSDQERVSPGQHTYVLRYRTSGWLVPQADRDELYWNVTGNEWRFPLDKVTATVLLPGEIPREEIEVRGWVGHRGSRDQSWQLTQRDTSRVRVETTVPLDVKQGFTIAVLWPEGAVDRTAMTPSPTRWIDDNLGSFLAVGGSGLAALLYGLSWILVGRDPQGRQVVSREVPPAALPPVVARYLKRMKYDHQCLASALVSAAQQGAIAIADGPHALAIRVESAAQLRQLPAVESIVVEALLEGDEQMVIQSQYRRVRKAVTDLKRYLKSNVNGTWFHNNRVWLLPGLLTSLAAVGAGIIISGNLPVAMFMMLWLSIWTIGVAVLGATVLSAWKNVMTGPHRGGCLAAVGAMLITAFATPFFLGEILGLSVLVISTSPWVVLSLVIGVLLAALFARWMKAPTPEGREWLDQIDAYQQWLETELPERLRRAADSEQAAAVYDQHLPWIVALGLDDQHCASLVGGLTQAGESIPQPTGYRPRWYRGTDLSRLGRAGVGYSLGAGLASAVASAASANRGSSSGSSGGGSSGGGGGGGGGGGW